MKTKNTKTINKKKLRQSTDPTFSDPTYPILRKRPGRYDNLYKTIYTYVTQYQQYVDNSYLHPQIQDEIKDMKNLIRYGNHRLRNKTFNLLCSCNAKEDKYCKNQIQSDKKYREWELQKQSKIIKQTK